MNFLALAGPRGVLSLSRNLDLEDNNVTTNVELSSKTHPLGLQTLHLIEDSSKQLNNSTFSCTKRRDSPSKPMRRKIQQRDGMLEWRTTCSTFCGCTALFFVERVALHCRGFERFVESSQSMHQRHLLSDHTKGFLLAPSPVLRANKFLWANVDGHGFVVSECESPALLAMG
eukprot:763504-Hanusia_phi.AAC.3